MRTTYDALGRVVVTNDSQFTTPTTQAYDADGRLVKLTSPQGYLNYAYDKLGRLTRTWTSQAADGVAPITDTVYAYDELGRLKTVQAVKRNAQNLNEGSTTYRYDKNGNLDLVLTPNTAAADYVYDSLNRLDLLRHFRDSDGDKAYDAGEPILAQFDYTVRADGKRTRVVELDGAGSTATIDWVYDELGRLVEERFDTTQGVAANDYIARYGFDLAGNRTLLAKDLGNATGTFAADETTTYVYDVNDRLTSEFKDLAGGPTGDTTTVYEYGGPTNPGTQQTKKTVTGDVSESHVSQYDVRGRMSQTVVTKGGSTTTNTYKYNAEGIRVGMTEQVGTGGVTTTVFHIDPHNHTGFAQILEEGVDSNVYIPADGRLQSTEISLAYALGHDVIEQGAGSGVTSRFYLYDGHGSTRGLMNFAATVLQRYAYDAYGVQLVFGNLTGAASASTRYLYSGERTDKATGWQNLQVRYLDPQTGRFITLDPFTGLSDDPRTLHKYLYAGADPIQFVDPSGQIFISAGIKRMLGGFASFELGLRALVGIAATYVLGNAYQEEVNKVDVRINSQLARLTDDNPPEVFNPSFKLRPDIQDNLLLTLYEIKTPLERPLGVAKMSAYLAAFNLRGQGYSPGTWSPEKNPYPILRLPGIEGLPPLIKINAHNSGFGIIVYTVDDYAIEVIAALLTVAVHVQDVVATVSAVYAAVPQVQVAMATLSARWGAI